METTKLSPLTRMIEDAETNLKTLVEQYNATVDQLQHLQMQAQQLKEDVISSKARYDALVEVNAMHVEG